MITYVIMIPQYEQMDLFRDEDLYENLSGYFAKASAPPRQSPLEIGPFLPGYFIDTVLRIIVSCNKTT